jgi:hypothetical protein
MKQKSAEACVVLLDRVRVSKVSDSRSSDLRGGNPRPCDGSSVGDQPFREHGPLIIPKLHDPVCSRKSAEGLNKQSTSQRGTGQTTRQRELFHVRTCLGAHPASRLPLERANEASGYFISHIPQSLLR